MKQAWRVDYVRLEGASTPAHPNVTPTVVEVISSETGAIQYLVFVEDETNMNENSPRNH
jgi:hypothetical protein